MSMDYIRTHYGVPAKRGMIIKYRGHLVRIVGSSGAYLRVRPVDGGHTRMIFRLHPTWEVEYPNENQGATP